MKNERVKGFLISKKSYDISVNGTTGMKVTLPDLSGFQVGDKVYFEILDNGTLLIIPSHIYENELIDKNKKEMDKFVKK